MRNARALLEGYEKLVSESSSLLSADRFQYHRSNLERLCNDISWYPFSTISKIREAIHDLKVEIAAAEKRRAVQSNSRMLNDVIASARVRNYMIMQDIETIDGMLRKADSDPSYMDLLLTTARKYDCTILTREQLRDYPIDLHKNQLDSIFEVQLRKKV